MKWFWVILVVAAAVAVFLLTKRESPESRSPESVSDSPPAPSIDSRPVESQPAEPARPALSVAQSSPAVASTAPIVSPTTTAPTTSSATQTIVPMGDRGVLIENRFSVHGRGTEADPYVVPWDLLISAGESYKPDAGQTVVPERVQVLEGSVVTINGYLAAPLLVEETSELLVMFNKWDGCCIGTPPTAFDAVEVKLQSPAKLAGKHMIRYGAVTGRMHVEPFLIGDMLVSLYRMDDGVLSWSP